MTAPLVVLGILSTVGGFVGLPRFLGERANLFHRFLDGMVPAVPGAAETELSRGMEVALIAASIAIAAAGWAVAKRCYAGPEGEAVPERFTRAFPRLASLVRDKFRIDELYDRILYRPFRALSRGFWKIADVLLIDGLVNAGSFLVELAGDLLRFFTTGNVRNYALTFLLGIVALIAFLGFGGLLR